MCSVATKLVYPSGVTPRLTLLHKCVAFVFVVSDALLVGKSYHD